MPVFLTILALESWINLISKEPPLLICESLILPSNLFTVTLRQLLLLFLGLLHLISIILIDLSFLALLLALRVRYHLLFEILVAFEEFTVRE
jgi:hypothetical protein